MGLLLSILVTCVGVIELLAFYHNVTRRVNPQPVDTSLTTVREQYLKELEGVRDRLVSQLEQLKEQHNIVSHRPDVPTLRLNSHEDIEVEFNGKAVSRSRSPSPRRFLVSEKKNASSTETRKFVVSEEVQTLQGIKKSKAQECLPEYLIEEQTQSDVPRYVLKDGDGPVPLPLPEKFLVTEAEPTIEAKTDVFRKKLGHNTVEVDGELFYRRSPSPFPSFDLTVPRNSICSELLDDSASVVEVDETSRSNSHSPVNVEPTYEGEKYDEINNNSEKVDVLLNASISAHNSTDYWENKALLVPQSKPRSRSRSPGVTKPKRNDAIKPRRRSQSESSGVSYNLDIQPVQKATSNSELSKVNDATSSDEDEEFMEVQPYTEEMKNSLDGVDKTKGCIKKKYVKRKRIKNRPDKTNQLGSSRSGNDVESTEKINSSQIVLPATRNSNKNTSCAKPGEPFWVNR